jgi:succinyl-diaminopimelate desuccinylase
MADSPNAQEHLAKLVSVRSITGDHAAASRAFDYIKGQLPNEMDVKIHESGGYSSLTATSRPGSTNVKLWLVGHIDVVDAKNSEFTLKEIDGKLFGRGAIDNKCAAAAFIDVCQQLGKDVSNYDFGIMLTSDEEAAGKNGTDHLVNELGYRGQVAFVPDSGTDWTIESKAKGVLHIKIEATGTTAHGAFPWEGDNAIDKLVKTLARIRRELKIRGHHVAKRHHLATMNIGTISGGKATNQVPDHAIAQVDIRLPEHEDLPAFRTVLARITELNPNIQITELGSASPVVLNPENPWFKNYIKILEHNNIKWDLRASCGTTDARFFAAVGIPTIVSQPHGGGIHGEDEWISKDGLQKLVSVTHDLVKLTA